jgi:anaerobic selenocysteine-containing dehydrogenase
MASSDTPTPPASWGRSTITTACTLDCPDSCSLSVTVERGRIVRIDASDQGPTTGGYICGKVRNFDRRVYSPERILHPLLRTGPRGKAAFERVTWDEALDLIVRRIEEARDKYGAESILPYYYGGSNGLLTNELTDARFFRRLGASRLARTVCAAPTGAAAQAMYGRMPGVAYEDYRHARLIVIWGCNPSASSIHLVSHVKQAQQAGAKLVVIDPRRTPLARLADLHLAVRPGTDLPVALAVANELFTRGWADEAFLAEHAEGAAELRQAAAAWPIEKAAAEVGLDPAALGTFAEWYGTTSPAVIRCGWGQERNRNGGASTLAILALPAIGGKFGVRGGGFTMSNSAAWGITQEALVDVPARSTRVVNMNQLGRALTSYDAPPVAVLFVYNSNPLSTSPDQNAIRRGLMRDDLFTIVHDQVMTDTALYADLVLPATTFLEHYDIARGYGSYHLQMVRPVIAPVGESRSNHDLFHDLSVRFGFAEPDDLGETGPLLETASRMPGQIGAALLADQQPEPPDGRHPVQFVDVHPRTPNAKVRLYPVELAPEPYAYQPDPATRAYPLALITPASERTVSSTLAELRPNIVKAKIHPDDAHARVIADGDPIRVFNALGEVHCEASVTPEVRPGTVALPKGLWARSTFNGATPNALVPDDLSAIGGGACFNDTRVQVELRGRH